MCTNGNTQTTAKGWCFQRENEEMTKCAYLGFGSAHFDFLSYHCSIPNCPFPTEHLFHLLKSF